MNEPTYKIIEGSSAWMVFFFDKFQMNETKNKNIEHPPSSEGNIRIEQVTAAPEENSLAALTASLAEADPEFAQMLEEEERNLAPLFEFFARNPSPDAQNLDPK
jgi:hypothetical protein